MMKNCVALHAAELTSLLRGQMKERGLCVAAVVEMKAG
jgi:hypothetical protein